MATVETARLRLRPFGPGDLEALAGIYGQPEVMQYIRTGQPRSRDETQRSLAAIMDYWRQHGFGLWAVELKETGTLIGQCGLIYLDNTAEVELAYLLDRPCWGRGLAGEAARASLRYGFEQLGLDRIVAVTWPANIASQRVLEKIGLRFEKEAVYYGQLLNYYALNRVDFSTGDLRMTFQEILAQLQALANPEAVAKMAGFGVGGANTYGIAVPALRQLAKTIGPDHTLAQQLWASGIHEARILASMIDRPKEVDDAQMDRWAGEFDAWDVCDQCCINLFWQTPFAYTKAVDWSARPEEFVKRAGFALMAVLAVHDKKAPDDKLAQFLPIICREAGDNRNFVKKAVNWALRQIGKRNAALNRLAIATAQEIQQMDSQAARWVAADALRELRDEKVQARLR